MDIIIIIKQTHTSVSSIVNKVVVTRVGLSIRRAQCLLLCNSMILTVQSEFLVQDQAVSATVSLVNIADLPFEIHLPILLLALYSYSFFCSYGIKQFFFWKILKNLYSLVLFLLLCQLGVFEMAEFGLQAVLNPSQMFLTEHDSDSEIMAGLAVAVILDGSRTFALEVQVHGSSYVYWCPIEVVKLFFFQCFSHCFFLTIVLSYT
jgi:hypothetical protein